MKRFLILLLSIAVFSIQAQEITQRCHTDEYLESLAEQYPGVENNMAMSKLLTQQKRQEMENANYQSGVLPVITIPTVVHVVYANQQQNISDAQVISQLDVLNEDFRATNADISIVDAQFTSIIADSEIEFCLATVDPQGNATDGINRVETTTSQFSFNTNVKDPADGGVAAWDPTSYLNIWVCNLGGGLLGYATPPGGPISEDGVVCLVSAFGDTGFVNPPYDLGRTATHEIGHYLSLAHPWGNFGGCSDDDGIADTPVSESPYFGCPNVGAASTSCNSQDCFYVFMDYCDDDCLVMFSEGQKADMVATLNSSRASLLQSEACGVADCPGLGNIGGNCTDLNGYPSTINSACECIEVEVDCPGLGISFGDPCVDSDGDPSEINYDCECQEVYEFAIVDASLSLQNMETFICDNNLEPTITIVNEGDTLITYFEIYYNINGAANQTQFWNGTLNEGQSVSITLFNAPVSSDITLNVSIGNVNNENGDIDMTDNDFSVSYTVPVYGQFPLVEAFEETSFEQNGWEVENIGNAGPEWQSMAYGSQGSLNSFSLDNAAGGTGELDFLTMPYMDLLGKTNISFHFDYAYANVGSVDELSIEYSIDCGITWVELWSKQGNDLATTTNSTSPFTPVFEDWAQEIIDLDFLNDQTKVATRFRNMSGGGSAIFVDNININFESEIPASIEDYLEDHAFGIYPNPSLNGIVHLFTSTLKHQDVNVLVFDINGKFILQSNFQNYTKLNLSQQANGYYFIQFVADGQMSTEKLLLAK